MVSLHYQFDIIVSRVVALYSKYCEGAEVIGKGLRTIILQRRITGLEIDSSGNPLGVLRGKPKKDGGKYSARR
jgi:hypothetical protein